MDETASKAIVEARALLQAPMRGRQNSIIYFLFFIIGYGMESTIEGLIPYFQIQLRSLDDYDCKYTWPFRCLRECNHLLQSWQAYIGRRFTKGISE